MDELPQEAIDQATPVENDSGNHAAADEVDVNVEDPGCSSVSQ